MRVMFCAVPSTGHIEPMLPLLRALISRGDQVAWASAAATHRQMQALGVQHCFDVGLSQEAAHAEYLRRWPQSTPTMNPALDPKCFSRLFGAVHAPAALDALVQAIRQWTPQLVVSETASLAAPLACELTDCVQVTHGFGTPPPERLLQDAAQAFGASWRTATGSPPPADAGLLRQLYLDIYPPSLQPPERLRMARSQGLRPCVPKGAGDQRLPRELAARLDRFADWPLVYVTFGTVVNREHGLRTAAAALASLKARLVVTVGGDGDLKLLVPLPPTMHVERFIAQADLLPHCDLVVSHGGSGTFLASLAHGLPQLVLPQGADQFINASALEDCGAGMALRGDDACADRIHDAAQTLLVDRVFQAKASRVATDMAVMPSVEAVAEMLQDLA